MFLQHYVIFKYIILTEACKILHYSFSHTTVHVRVFWHILFPHVWKKPIPVAARLLRLRVRIPPGAWMSVCCECCVLSGRDLCDALITRPEEFYRLWCVLVCDLETSRMRTPWPALGRSATEKKCLKEILVSAPWRWRNNIAETCRSYVKDSMYEW